MTKLTKIVVAVVIISSSLYALPKLGMTEKQYREMPIKITEEEGIKTCEYEGGYAVLYKEGICVACGLIDVDKYESVVSVYTEDRKRDIATKGIALSFLILFLIVLCLRLEK